MARCTRPAPLTLALTGLGVACLPVAATAQTLAYGAISGADEASSGDSARQSPRRSGGGGRTRLSPYIEAAQVVGARISPDDEVLTWTSLAAGVDGSVQGRNTAASFSIRYEHRFGWGHKTGSGDAISGMARAAVAVVPRTLMLEAGALATRTTVDGRSAAVPGSFAGKDSAELYAIYAGPRVSTHAGDVAIDGGYRFGYAKAGTSQTLRTGANALTADTFDHSTTHNADVHAGTRPGTLLPVGLGAGAGYVQEDVSNLDQQVRDFHARGDVMVPVSSSVALVGGAGYENVKVSSRDVLRDAGGAPIIGNDGRWVTDQAAPRRIAYQTEGFIWDAGVTWRPSRRTALEAHVGHRYGGFNAYGSFGWRATRRSTVNLSAYDNLSGFGGQLGRALVGLPTDFAVLRDPATGAISGCVAATGDPAEAPTGVSCITNGLGSLRSAVFRARGVQASYLLDLGRFRTGIAAGYDRRRFIAAPGTILAAANGVVDENTWLTAWLTGRLDERSSFSTYAYASWFHSSQLTLGDGTALGANASVSRDFGNRISGNASVGIQGLQRDAAEDLWQASALLGLRYSFF